MSLIAVLAILGALALFAILAFNHFKNNATAVVFGDVEKLTNFPVEPGESSINFSELSFAVTGFAIQNDPALGGGAMLALDTLKIDLDEQAFNGSQDGEPLPLDELVVDVASLSLVLDDRGLANWETFGARMSEQAREEVPGFHAWLQSEEATRPRVAIPSPEGNPDVIVFGARDFDRSDGVTVKRLAVKLGEIRLTRFAGDGAPWPEPEIVQLDFVYEASDVTAFDGLREALYTALDQPATDEALAAVWPEISNHPLGWRGIFANFWADAVAIGMDRARREMERGHGDGPSN